MKKFLLLTLAAATVTVVMAQQKANLPKSPVENLVRKIPIRHSTQRL